MSTVRDLGVSYGALKYFSTFSLIFFSNFRYLSGGSSIFYVSRLFRLGVTTVREITQEVTQVLWEELKHDYLPEVDGQQWQRYSAEFESRWNLPHCCAAVDGKHVTITCPPNSGSMYYNYKKQYSIVLMAMCDANYNFVGVDIGAYGGNADGSVFAQSAFGYRLLHGELELPQPSALPNGDVLPYFIVGDAAFPLKSNLMRPYPGRNLEILQENFNYRLSRARRTIENAFGVLVARWRILLSPLQLQPDAAENIVKASVVLHNFVKRHNANQYAPPSFVDHIGQEGEIIVPGEWRSQVDPLVGIDSDFVQRGNNAARNAYQARDVLAKYLLETRFR